MSHVFLVDEDESQTRGVTWFHAVCCRARTCTNTPAASSSRPASPPTRSAFLKKNRPTRSSSTVPRTTEGNEKAVAIDVAPLSMNELPAGYKLSQFDPKQPTQNHSEFKKSMCSIWRRASTSWAFRFRRYVERQFQSARVGLGEERDVWRDLQSVVSNFAATSITAGCGVHDEPRPFAAHGERLRAAAKPELESLAAGVTSTRKRRSPQIDSTRSAATWLTYRQSSPSRASTSKSFSPRNRPKRLCSSNTAYRIRTAAARSECTGESGSSRPATARHKPQDNAA
jgi:hypothetical protein